jgi:hypothetical protein
MIRSSARRIRLQADPDAATYQKDLESILAVLLDGALTARSATDVAVILGSAAELQTYPDEALFARAMDVLAQGDILFRGVYWAVRHRCSKSLSSKRFKALRATDYSSERNLPPHMKAHWIEGRRA